MVQLLLKKLLFIFLFILTNCKPHGIPESDLTYASQEPISDPDHKLVDTLCSDNSMPSDALNPEDSLSDLPDLN